MNNSTDDPGSLDRLHELITPPPVSWWPLAPAWYLLVVFVLLSFGLLIAWVAVNWKRNWYRRAGLAELEHIERKRPYEPGQLIELAKLTKRVALVAYPRDQVASLTGEEWLQFLDQTVETTAFSTGPGRQFADVYGMSALPPTPELLALVRDWIRRHRRDVRC